MSKMRAFSLVDLHYKIIAIPDKKTCRKLLNFTNVFIDGYNFCYNVDVSFYLCCTFHIIPYDVAVIVFSLKI